MLDEALRVVRQVWSDDDGPFHGRWFDLAETRCSPQPLHAVPVMVGGTDERKALRLVARHADACHLFAGGDLGADWVAGRLAALREHCETEGTSYDAIARTVMWTDPVRAGLRRPHAFPGRGRRRRGPRQAGGCRPRPLGRRLAGVVSAVHGLG